MITFDLIKTYQEAHSRYGNIASWGTGVRHLPVDHAVFDQTTQAA